MEQLVVYGIILVGVTLLGWVSFKWMLTQESSPYSFHQVHREGPKVQYGHHGVQGQRPSMEDSYICDRIGELLILGVCDGHNGDRASGFCSRYISGELSEQLKRVREAARQPDVKQTMTFEQIKQHAQERTKALMRNYVDFPKEQCMQGQDPVLIQALTQTVQELDKRFLQQAKPYGVQDGTTLCALCLSKNDVIAVNVGDSRAVLCSNGVAADLTTDHKPEDTRVLVEAAGGFVHPLCTVTEENVIYQGPDRIYPGGLAVGRAVGDLLFKDQQYLQALAVTHPLVYSEPEMSCVSAAGADFALVGCDGLFDVMTTPDVIRASQVVLAVLFSTAPKRGDILRQLGVSTAQQRAYFQNAQLLCQILCKLALENGSTDNVSAACLIFEQFVHRKSPKMEDICGETAGMTAEMQTLVFNALVDDLGFEPGDTVTLQTLLEWHSVFLEYFPQGESEEIHMSDTLQKGPEIVSEIAESRDRLWKELAANGAKLSNIRTTPEETGISLAGPDYVYEIVGL